MSAPVEAVIFDWGGTLTPWHSIDLAEQWRVFARAHPAHAHEAEDVVARVLAAEERAWARVRGDGGSARIDEVLREAGVATDGSEAAHAAYREFWEPHTLLDPEVPPLFEGLRERGLRIGVLSNTLWSREYHDSVFARDGVLHLIDGAVYTSELAVAKPHPDAFAAALAAVGVVDPARAVFVGDRPFEDVHGAQRAGLRAVLVPHSDIPVSQQVAGRGHADVRPDAVVHRLGDLLAVLDSWA